MPSVHGFSRPSTGLNHLFIQHLTQYSACLLNQTSISANVNWVLSVIQELCKCFCRDLLLKASPWSHGSHRPRPSDERATLWVAFGLGLPWGRMSFHLLSCIQLPNYSQTTSDLLELFEGFSLTWLMSWAEKLLTCFEPKKPIFCVATSWDSDC